MGRVYRARKRGKKNFKSVKLSSNELIINLKKWLRHNGWSSSSNVEVALFPSLGRGIIAKKAIGVGDIIAQVPLHLLITVHTVTKSVLRRLFSEITWKPQQVLSAYLIWEMHLDEDSYWFHYLKVLPVDYDSPVFSGVITGLPPFIIEQITYQRSRIKSFHCELLNSCRELICHHCNRAYIEIFTEKLFFLCWFTVNSRCVYISPSDNLKHDLLLSEPDSLALVPFLDLYNHSDRASVKAEVKDNSFRLTTNVSFSKFEQVFINYGSHNNTKLFLEYGFFIPNNSNDSFPLSLEDILSIFQSLHPERSYLSEKKRLFLESYRLTSNLQITYEGFSWTTINLINILFIEDHLLYNYNFMNDVSDIDVRNLCKTIVEVKCKEFDRLLSSQPVSTFNSKYETLNFKFVGELIKLLQNCKSIVNNYES